MIEFRPVDRRHGIGRFGQFESVRTALQRLETPADNDAFDDVLIALDGVDWPVSARAARRAA